MGAHWPLAASLQGAGRGSGRGLSARKTNPNLEQVWFLVRTDPPPSVMKRVCCNQLPTSRRLVPPRNHVINCVEGTAHGLALAWHPFLPPWPLSVVNPLTGHPDGREQRRTFGVRGLMCRRVLSSLFGKSSPVGEVISPGSESAPISSQTPSPSSHPPTPVLSLLSASHWARPSVQPGTHTGPLPAEATAQEEVPERAWLRFTAGGPPFLRGGMSRRKSTVMGPPHARVTGLCLERRP